MNIKMKHIRIILISFVGLILTSLLVYTAFVFLNDKDKGVKDPKVSVRDENSLTLMSDKELDSAIQKKGYTAKEVQSMSKAQKDKALLGKDYFYEDNKIRLYSDNSKAPEYSGDVESKYKKYIEYMVEGKYSSVVSDVKQILANNNLTKGDNLKLAAIYSDAVKMKEYPSLDKLGKEAVLTSHHDPVALSIDTLFAYVRRREAVILDSSSKTPVFEGSYKVKSYAALKTTDSAYKEYEKKWVGSSIRNIYKVELSLPQVPDMYCIVLENNEGALKISGYYGDTANVFLSVSERAQMGVDKE